MNDGEVTDSPSDPGVLDASDDAIGDDGSDPGPTTCADVGRYPGLATCCAEHYCGGICRPAHDGASFCDCAGVLGGCQWKTICCTTNVIGCVGLQVCAP